MLSAEYYVPSQQRTTLSSTTTWPSAEPPALQRSLEHEICNAALLGMARVVFHKYLAVRWWSLRCEIKERGGGDPVASSTTSDAEIAPQPPPARRVAGGKIFMKHNTRTKVLIVDDDSDVRHLYAIGLNRRGFEVKLASNGAQALERIRTEKPDVILLDWLMPLIGGAEVIDHITSDGAASAPIIVVSGRPAPASIDPRVRSWLTKPVGIDELVAEIERQPRPATNSQVR